MLNWRDPDNPMAGGAERVTLAYLAGLARRGHEVHWIAHGFRGGAARSRIQGVHILRAGRAPASILRAVRWTRRQAPFDLIIDQHHGLPWFAPWWGRARVVAYIHEVLGPIWNSFYPWPLSALGRAAESGLLRAYARIPFWTASGFTEKELRRRGVREVVRIPYGVDTPARSPLPRKRLSDPLRLVVVSRLAPNKRIDHAIRVLPLLRRTGVEARLAIVGDGQCRRSLEALSARLAGPEQVEFAGRVSEERKLELLDGADLLLHTSVREGWGLNVIEAGLRGAPAVVYPVPGLVESTADGLTGWVAEEETPEAMARAIARAIRDPEGYLACRREAQARARQHAWERILPSACQWLEDQARAPRDGRKGQPPR